MATFTKINDFVKNLSEVINLGSDSLVVALSNTAPASETNNPTTDGKGVLANVTQISYTNISSRVITTSSSSQTSGTYKLVIADLVLTASGAVGPFQYVYVYDDTTTAPADSLICEYNYGSAVTLANGDTFTLDFDITNGLLQIA